MISWMVGVFGMWQIASPRSWAPIVAVPAFHRLWSLVFKSVPISVSKTLIWMRLVSIPILSVKLFIVCSDVPRSIIFFVPPLSVHLTTVLIKSATVSVMDKVVIVSEGSISFGETRRRTMAIPGLIAISNYFLGMK